MGVIAPQGIARVADLVAVLLGEGTTNVPALAREALRGLAGELEALDRRVKEIEGAIVRWHKDNEASRRLAAIPGVGPITASAIVATITDPFQFHSARHLAAWIGLVPRQHSSGGKQRQGGISKQGDRYLRRLLVLGATAVHDSWWPVWERWVSRYSGGEVPARHPGDGKLAPIEDAPGSYVKVRAED